MPVETQNNGKLACNLMGRRSIKPPNIHWCDSLTQNWRESEEESRGETLLTVWMQVKDLPFR
jgi:hypothetical protein